MAATDSVVPQDRAAGVDPAATSPPHGRGRRTRRRTGPGGVRRWNRREALAGYLFISPWIVGFLVFTAGAMVWSLVISFSDYNLATNAMDPVGFENYARLVEDPRVRTSLANTLFFAVMAVPLEVVLALGLAMLLARLGRVSGFFRTVYYLPKMTPAVATAAVFFLLLNGNTGAINQFLGFLGIERVSPRCVQRCGGLGPRRNASGWSTWRAATAAAGGFRNSCR